MSHAFRGRVIDDLLRAMLIDRVRHFRREVTRRNRIDRDVLRREEFRHDAREVVHAGLRRGIRIGFEVRYPDALDRTDVDHPRIGVRRSRRFQQTKQTLGQEEHRFHVEIHHLVPAVLGEIGEGCPPTRTGTVDQNVEALLPLLKFAGQACDLFHARKVGRDGDAFADLRQLFCKCLASFGAPRGDIDLGAVFDVGAGDHFAEAATSAGDQGDLPPNREQLFDFHASLLMNWKYVVVVGAQPMAPAARIWAIVAASKPASFSTSSLCWPTEGGILGCTLSAPRKAIGLLIVFVSLSAKGMRISLSRSCWSDGISSGVATTSNTIPLSVRRLRNSARSCLSNSLSSNAISSRERANRSTFLAKRGSSIRSSRSRHFMNSGHCFSSLRMVRISQRPSRHL